MNKKAIIAMSGGVDSSVAAYIIKQRGYDCIGVTMKLFHNEDIGIQRSHTCCSLHDVEDARSVAFLLDIPYYVFNFTEQFKETVIDRFISAYENGMTPNPCIDCNKYLKFDELFLRARQLDYDYVVTGHYAQIEFDEASQRYLLKKALDISKDQSYVLYTMTQEQLAHALFPLGNMKKSEVRILAEEQYFRNAEKPDSQDICFVQNGSYADFIEQYTGKLYPRGNFIDIAGNVLGHHNGIINYTLGQRKGMGVSFGKPMYVKDINPNNNTVTLSEESTLFTKKLTANKINLISVAKFKNLMRLKARIRYRQPEDWATVTQTDEDALVIEFDKPQRAVTKGQAVVLYDDDYVVGGGIINGTFD